MSMTKHINRVMYCKLDTLESGLKNKKLQKLKIFLLHLLLLLKGDFIAYFFMAKKLILKTTKSLVKIMHTTSFFSVKIKTENK